MKKGIKFVFFLATFIVVLATVSYPVLFGGNYTYTGNGRNIAEVFSGRVTLQGNDNQLTVKAGSEVEVLSVLGNANQVYIEPGANVLEIRGIGLNNRVDAPADLQINQKMFLNEQTADDPAEPSDDQDVKPSLDGF